MGHLARLQTLSLLGCLPNSPHGEFAPTSTHPAIKCFKFIFLIPRKKRQHCAQDETKHVYFSFFNPLKVTSLNDSLLFSYAPRYRRVKNTIQQQNNTIQRQKSGSESKMQHIQFDSNICKAAEKSCFI